MSSAGKKGSSNIESGLPSAEKFRFGVVVAKWNEEVTRRLKEACIQSLQSKGAKADHIFVVEVPGSFELPAAARILAKAKTPDAIICLGCIIQGETKHDEYIASAVANGLVQLTLGTGIPVIFGVLTTHTFEQALERAGGIHGNKGEEAAHTALHMAALNEQISGAKNKIGF